MKKQSASVIFGLFFSLLIPIIGYFYVGTLVALLFLIGYIGGFLLWLFIPAKVPYTHIQAPYWASLLVYILLHKVEENRMKFFEVLGQKITGIPVPPITPLLIFSLLILPVGAWLIVPYLVKRGYNIGYYLAWTFFANFGIVELAHFVFPLLTDEPYGYFPGMASAGPLALLGWWGMWRLSGYKFRT